ncbi:MAG TPA: phosphatase PAP2 family protein, partial [Actinotalea sp.]|nr:phosphatase PAP2 family protein [Actinotalea sp.]
AFYLSVALLAQRIGAGGLRVTVTVLCSAVPLLVAAARLYMGMHHVSDVVVGALNGAVCVWLGWHYLRRAPARESAGVP